MARKYETYQLAADFGRVDKGYTDYKEAKHDYDKCKAPKTLLGISPKGSAKVIFSVG